MAWAAFASITVFAITLFHQDELSLRGLFLAEQNRTEQELGE